jgi:hypothetical protein
MIIMETPFAGFLYTMRIDVLLSPSQCEQACAASHYVNLLALQPDQEHTALQWLDAAQAETDETVHPYVRAYAGRVGNTAGDLYA